MKDLAVENEFMSVVFITVPALVHKIRKGPESNSGRRFHEMYFCVNIIIRDTPLFAKQENPDFE